MAKTARFVKDVSYVFAGRAFVYELSEPLEGHTYVVASGVDLTERFPEINWTIFGSGLETYIFGWDMERGEINDWGELEGSTKGILSPPMAIENAGYEIEGEGLGT